ncbi:MAG: hypothetical protein WEA54_04525, partial [Actinomycetota bacterium]
MKVARIITGLLSSAIAGALVVAGIAGAQDVGEDPIDQKLTLNVGVVDEINTLSPYGNICCAMDYEYL